MCAASLTKKMRSTTLDIVCRFGVACVRLQWVVTRVIKTCFKDIHKYYCYKIRETSTLHRKYQLI